MFKFYFPLILLVILATGFNFADLSLNAQEPVRNPESNAASSETIAKTVQISLNVDADLLIENSEGKRLGLDFKSRRFVNEIPAAQFVSKETSATYVLPFDKSGRPYAVTLSGKSATGVDADLSM